MKIWQLGHYMDEFQGLNLLDVTFEWRVTYWSKWFDTKPLKEIWSPLKVEIDPETKQRPACDFPHLITGTLAMTETALQVIAPLLDGNGELLPLRSQTQTYWVFNVTRLVDCLDDANTTGDRLESGRLWHVDQFAWLPDCYDETHIFKIPEFKTGKPFVSDEFKIQVESNNLKGLRFNKAF